MKKVLLIGISCFICIVSVAQKSGSIKGIVFDTIAKQSVGAATITVLQRSDSSLVTFTMTNSKGEFNLTNVGYGDYRLLVTHVNYHNVNKYFTINDAHKSIDLANIEVSDKNKVLEEVVVMAEAPPVTLIGDTVQYNAGSFKTKPNAVVEDLLKKMPGIQVEKDGTVKAQGQEVKKVLVDGKEFFGNDPKIATKNLPADAVDKVQVYDRQSDMAQLTGFDDGNSEKTINLKLKKDKKKGVFGKVNAGGGTEGRYQGRFNVNSFKGARQMSVIGMGNNTNAEGFSFMDILSFSGGMSQLGGGGGGNINISMSSNDPMAGAMGGGNNNAINTSWAGGANYNNIIGNKMEVQSNYFFSRYNPLTNQQLSRQYVLPDSTYFYKKNSLTNNLSYSHRFNLTYDYLIDSMHSLKFTPSLSLQNSRNRSLSDYETLSQELQRSNRGVSNNYSENDGYNFSGTLLFRKKFKRKGRTFSVSVGSTLNNSEGNGELESLTQFYNKLGNLFRTDSINQRSFSESEVRGYNTRAVYTEPLFKRSLLEFSVSKNESRSVSDQTTYDYNRNSGKHDVVNPFQTNNYENIYGTKTAGVRLRTQKKKYNYSVGVTWQNAGLEGTITSGIKDSVITKSFYNLLPNARFQYNFTRFKSFQLDYRASTTQPSVSQLQPIPDISNRLYIREGNPDLQQEFTHRINANYNGVNPYRGKSFFWFSSYSFTNNKIVNFDIVDSFGIRTKPVNVDGVYNLNNDLSLGLPLRFIKATMNFNTGIGYSKTIQFIDSARNNIYNLSIDPNLEISKSFKDKFDITVGAGFTYNRAKYSLQSSLNNRYFTQDYTIDLGWQLPKNFYLSSDFRYTVSSNRAAGYNAKVPLWAAAFSKLFLKYNRGEIKLSVHDLLNENQRIVRYTNNNYIEDQNNRVLKRFFLLSFTYSLNKMSANSGAQGKGNIIIRR